MTVRYELVDSHGNIVIQPVDGPAAMPTRVHSITLVDGELVLRVQCELTLESLPSYTIESVGHEHARQLNLILFPISYLGGLNDVIPIRLFRGLGPAAQVDRRTWDTLSRAVKQRVSVPSELRILRIMAGGDTYRAYLEGKIDGAAVHFVADLVQPKPWMTGLVDLTA